MKIDNCPFCGGEAVYLNLGDSGHWVECGNDRCKVKPCIEEGQPSKRKAISDWNTRHTQPTL